MDLKKLIVENKEVWVTYPGDENFKVKVQGLSRKELTKLRKRCTRNEWDKKSRATVEVLDEEAFVEEFTEATIKDWEGLTLTVLENFLLLNTEGQDMEQEIKYDKEMAELLIRESSEFDTWINEVVFDLDTFRTRK
jgi:hypothetical protein